MSENFLLDQQASGGRQIGGDVVVGALCAVHDTEAVGDEDLTEGGDLLGVCGTLLRILAGLLRVETDVLQQHDITVAHRGDLGLRVLTIGVGGQRNGDAEQR